MFLNNRISLFIILEFKKDLDMKYIALLRGINIGRKNRVKMADLKEFFELMDFKNTRTYLQSGNVIFEHNLDNTEKIASEIEKGLIKTYEFPVNVIVMTKNELKDVINNNPFINEDNVEIDKLHVIFLQEIPNKEIVSDLDMKKSENEKFKIIGKEIYLYLPNGYAKTKLNNNIFEKKLNTIATTRNWKTVNKLLELANN